MRVYWSEIPLFRFLLPFLVGIASQCFYPLNITKNDALLLGLSGCILLTAIFYFARAYTQRNYFGIVMQFVLLMLGISYSTQSQKIKFDQGILDKKELYWLGKVDQLNYSSGKLKSIDVTLISIRQDSKWRRNNLKARLPNPQLNFKINNADYVFGKGTFTLPQAPINPTQFNYINYLKNKGVAYLLIRNKIIHKRQNESFSNKLAVFRKHLLKGFASYGINGHELSVLSALILGDKSDLDNELRSKYANAGVMHVLAVSGLHVGIVYLLLSQFFNIFNKKLIPSWLRLMALLAAIWSFAALTGLSPSVQRASFMFSFILISEFKSRKSNIINSICGSALLLILFNPRVIFNLGFQLSYSAVIGIVLLYPKLYSFLYFRNKLLDKAWSLMVVSISAQLATLPITLFYFHQFPTYFLLSNILVIPLAFLIVALSFLFSISWTLFNYSFFIDVPLNFLLEALNVSVQFINSLPYSAIKDIWIHDFSAILLLLAIVFFVHHLYYHKYLSIFFSLTLIFICLTLEFIIDYNQLNKSSIRIYALSPQCLVFTSAYKADVIYNTDTLSMYSKKVISGHLASDGIRSISWRSLKDSCTTKMPSVEILDEVILYAYKNVRIAHLQSSTLSNHQKLFQKVDILLISKEVFLSNSQDLSSASTFKIFDSSIPIWSKFHEMIAEKCNVYYLNKKGYLEFHLK